MTVSFTAPHDAWGTSLNFLGVPRAQSSSSTTVVAAQYNTIMVDNPAEPGQKMPIVDPSLLRTPGEYLVTLVYESAEDSAEAFRILTEAGYPNVQIA